MDPDQPGPRGAVRSGTTCLHKTFPEEYFNSKGIRLNSLTICLYSYGGSNDSKTTKSPK